MATFLEDLKTYLLPVSELASPAMGRDVIPDKPDQAVGLFLYSHPGSGKYNYPASTRYIQIQCRAPNPDDAYSLACTLCTALDKQEPIDLAARKVNAIIRTRPRKLKVDDAGRTTYYFEIAALGDNTP